VSRPAQDFPVWRALLRAARPYRRAFAVVALLTLLATAADLVAPVIYRYAVNDIAGLFVAPEGGVHVTQRERESAASSVDSVIGEESAGDQEPSVADRLVGGSGGYVASRTPEQAFRTLLFAVIALFIVNVVSHRLMLAADQRTVELASGIEGDVIRSTFSHVLRLPMQWFARRTSGGVGRQIDQADQIAPIVRAAAHEIAPEVFRMVGAVAIMATQSWRLTLVALITLPPYLWLVRRSSGRLERGLAQYYELWEGVSGRIQDALASIKTVKLAGAERRESERLGATSREAYGAWIERNRLANHYVFWQNSLSFLSQALVLGYGGWLVLERQLTPGDVVMFVVYLDKLFSPIETLTGLSVSLQENAASARRALRLLATDLEPAPDAPLRRGPGHVQFQGLRFSYHPGREVLRGVDLELQPGRVTAIVGPSGAGKTTLADLLLRLYAPDAGDILIDGQSTRGLDPASVRAAMAVVAADGAVFRGRLADNLRYQRPAATDADLVAAARAAGLGPLLERLPEGLQTEIGERGVGLSLGERQRVQIARALVAQPAVLVLDEATANLDYATEGEIRRAIYADGPRPTTLVIAHRFSMVEHADHVVVLDRGRVVEQGTPAELIAAGGWFARFAAGSGGKARIEARGRDGGAASEPHDEAIA
jgi:ATP-binding cassette subfamily B protein